MNNYEDGKRWVFTEEKHRATKELLMIELAGLDFVKRDDDIFEEFDMLFSEGNCKSTDDTGEDIEKLSYTVKFIVFMDQGVELVGDGFSDHFSSWDELGVESVEDVLKVFSFSRFLRIKELQEFLHESMSDKHFQWLDITNIIKYQLIEQLVNRL